MVQKCILKQKKFFFENFWTTKNRHFWPKLEVFGQKWPFSDPKGHFFRSAKKIFDSIIFCAHLERHFELSYAPIPQCMWRGSAKIQILGQCLGKYQKYRLCAKGVLTRGSRTDWINGLSLMSAWDETMLMGASKGLVNTIFIIIFLGYRSTWAR